MSRRYFAPFMFVVSACSCLLCHFSTEAQNLQDSRCVTMLLPRQCGSAGNSMCQTLAGDPGGCISTACAYCNSSVAVADKVCASWYVYTCSLTGGAATNCGSNNTWRIGACENSGGCLCLNPMDNGSCGTSTWAYPCN